MTITARGLSALGADLTGSLIWPGDPHTPPEAGSGARYATWSSSRGGGPFARVPVPATAFPHRGARFMLKHTARASSQASDERRRSLGRWIVGSWRIAHRYGAGGVYVNYADPAIPAWDPAYHGANLPRLSTIKDRYDPTGLFTPP